MYQLLSCCITELIEDLELEQNPQEKQVSLQQSYPFVVSIALTERNVILVGIAEGHVHVMSYQKEDISAHITM